MRTAIILFTFAAVPCLGNSLQLNSSALDPALFHVTEFATGLSNPLASVRLSDGSIGVGTYNSILRFTDTNHDGVADAAGSALYSAPGARLGLVEAGGYYIDSHFHYITSSPSSTITILQPGTTAADQLTVVGTLQVAFPSGWIHSQPGIAVRPTPRAAGSFDLVFNVGSQFDHSVSTSPVQVSGLTTAAVDGDSLYALTLNLSGAAPSASNVRKIASGIRNVIGMGFQPGTGDFYFVDNAIDGTGPLGDEPPQAEELNRITAADFDNGSPHDFGYPNCYVQYRTGTQIGSGCVTPLVALQPIPNGTALGSESEGATQLAFAPANFPAAFRNGVFIGFSGKGGVTGTANEENAIVYYDFTSGNFIHFSENSQNGVYQPIGLLSTEDALYISDFGAGKVYQVSAVPEPGTLWLMAIATLLLLAAGRYAVRDHSDPESSGPGPAWAHDRYADKYWQRR